MSALNAFQSLHLAVFRLLLDSIALGFELLLDSIHIESRLHAEMVSQAQGVGIDGFLQEVKTRHRLSTANLMEHSLCNMQSALFLNRAQKRHIEIEQVETLSTNALVFFSLFIRRALFPFCVFHGIHSNYTFNNP